MTSEDINPKSVIEAALFASGRTLSTRELADLSGLSEERVRAVADDLAAEYAQLGARAWRSRASERAMPCRSDPAWLPQVVTLAPRELEAPLIRTLAIIAYKQPLKQSELVEIRGNKGYEHVKELEKRGLISAVKQGRTKALSTTRAFADYFGLASGNPQAVRRAILKDKLLVGVSLQDLALRLGLDFIVVNPYRPQADDLERLEEIDLLILAPGYAEKVREHYSGEMIEASVRTLSQLKESGERICQAAGSGDVEPLAAELDALLQRYRRRAEQARAIRPLTPMIEEIARDLKIAVSDDGLTAAPPGIEADILVPVHQPYDMDIVERIVQRYEKILELAARKGDQ